MSDRGPRGIGGPFVPVPAFYLDRAMPVLTDTELRVLLVVIRQTLGWAAGGQAGNRKERDWISLRQFERSSSLARLFPAATRLVAISTPRTSAPRCAMGIAVVPSPQPRSITFSPGVIPNCSTSA
jgi:hypothetical protein